MRTRRMVTIDRQWFGAHEVRPQFRPTLLDRLGRLFSRSLALVS